VGYRHYPYLLGFLQHALYALAAENLMRSTGRARHWRRANGEW